MNKAILAFALAAGFSTIAMGATYKGYIIDQKCSNMKNMRGDVDCAQKCIKAGSPAVLVTDSGKVYKIADQEKVIPMAGKQVTINGTMKNGEITVSSIQ
ncbi:MAG TPA: hypothetical protein VJ732_14880 [Bryobacteraceae bacterium]|nr:hypothetical protein [Bryobacteraceae bacterium]